MSVGRVRAFRWLAALVAALLVAGGGASAAFADQLAVDGDGATPLVNGTAAIVAACTDKAVEFNVLIAARRNGQVNQQIDSDTNNIFANGTEVTVGDLGTGSNGMTAAFADNTITLPDDWQSQSTNYQSSATITAVVTLPAQSAGGSGTIAFSYAGKNNYDVTHSRAASVTGHNSLSVSWTTAPCAPTDTTPPVLTLPADQILEATGPGGATATFTAAADDIVDGAVPVDCVPASGSTFPLGDTEVTCSATDTAGNTATGTFTVTVRDTTPPVLTLPADLTVDATGLSGAVVDYSATADDIVDGAVPVDCVPASGSTFPLGDTEVTCSATDEAGNTATGTFTVSVKLGLTGFYQPVDMTGVVNTVKSGSTVPLKFEVFAGSTELTDTAVVKSFTAIKYVCDSSDSEEPVDFTTTGGTSLRYDTTAGQFIQNWRTPKGAAGSCYEVTMTTLDGSSITALFELK